jgi:tripartite-type tricarboxylate transporter receptor subunit TctC
VKKVICFISLALLLIIGLTAISCAEEAPAPAPAAGPEGYPERPITFIIGYGAGGGTDRACRSVGKAVEDILQIRMAYVNLPGGAGSIAEDYLLKQPADGYTILGTSGDLPINLLVGRNPNQLEDYIPFARAQQDTGQIQISTKDTRYTNLEEFVAYAKGNKVAIGGTGAGGLDEIGVTQFAIGAGFFENLDYVTYEKAGTMRAAVVAGDLDACWEEPGSAIELIEAGELTPIITFALERVEGFEDVPTAAEMGYGEITVGRTRGFMFKAGTDEAIVSFMEDIFGQAYNSDYYQKWEEEHFLHLRPGWGDRATYTQQCADQKADFETVLKELGYM